MRHLLLSFLCILPAWGQAGFNPVMHLASRPPQCWVDAKQFIETNAPDRMPVTNKLVDYSGHGFTFVDASGLPNTNCQYFTRLTGCISSMGVSVPGGVIGNAANSNTYHVQMLSGPGSERQVNRGKHTNQCTLAVRINYRTGNGQVIQTGTIAGPVAYGYAQILTGTLYWDWGEGTSFRVSKALPADFTDNWVNVFFTRGRTNQDIWMQGPSGPLTNFVSGRGTGLGNSGTANSGDFSMFGTGAATNWYVKRYIIWDYELPPADLAAWSKRMSDLP